MKLMVVLVPEFCSGMCPAPAFCSGMHHMHIFNPMHTSMCLHLSLEIARVGFFYHDKKEIIDGVIHPPLISVFERIVVIFNPITVPLDIINTLMKSSYRALTFLMT